MKTIRIAATLLLCAVLQTYAPVTGAVVKAPLTAPAAKDRKFDKPLVKLPAGEPTRTFSTGSFSNVSVGTALEVIVRKGRSHKVVAYGPTELVNELVAKESGGEIVIRRTDKNHTNENQKITLLIESPSVTAVNFSGATNGMIEGFSGGNFALRVSGASNAQLDTDCSQLALNSSGASNLEILGKATMLAANVSGASKLSAFGLKVADVNVEASGASQAKVTATGSLHIGASGASTVLYAGNPKDVKTEVTGMSSVKKS